MSIKIFSKREFLDEAKRKQISEAIHESMQEALGLPEGKRFQRFIPLDKNDMVLPGGGEGNYVNVEIMLMSGRAPETKRKLIKSIFKNMKELAGVETNQVEIQIIESPHENWGFRGMTGSEALGKLNYKIVSSTD
mmetsp:Transcript_1345/g.1475  ORF Transcript_1345/g.1475 Transcript_1345/m.1475 type:complete len:135 (+) Transcript_1345:343-747(+)|eukprot:CAMPEP_0184017750 /NCGR_PEP_ID=MMETSP0954-20121128/7729_1 /TAXON_ID=627963 /ORGANISM="Aplanochytrium sp, Strain PBS07" /LENGTH=134 /DNA_ID=CAMNT_0026299059 /DNA_START=467 /DNA_END=871 /DNA_ORIENTATION=-